MPNIHGPLMIAVALSLAVASEANEVEATPLPLPERSMVKPIRQLAADAAALGLPKRSEALRRESHSINPGSKLTRYAAEFGVGEFDYAVSESLYPNLEFPMVQGEVSGNVRMAKLEDEDAFFTAESFRRESGERNIETESIVGTDDRVKLGPATDVLYPFSTVAKIYCHFPDLGWYEGTATMIGPRHVLTCGHMIYDWDYDVMADAIDIVPAMSGSSMPFGSTWGIKCYMNTGWAAYGRAEHDMAVVALNDPIGLQTGWMGYATLGNNAIKKLKIRSLGYPGDRDDGERMYYSVDTLFKPQPFTPYFVRYVFDTAGGQSGSPVFRYINGYPFVYAVHGYGMDSDYNELDHNLGVRLTREKTTLIYNWLRQPLPAPVLTEP